MITSTNGSMELIISEPHFLPSLLKSHHHYYHKSSDYASKEAECNNPKNKIQEVKLRNNNNNNRPIDIHQQQQNPISPSITVSKIGSLTIDESLPVRIKH